MPGKSGLPEICLLGPLEVRLSGGVIALPSRGRRVLAILVLARNNIVSTEFLIDELWSTPPSTARQQVHNAITGLRRTLAAERRISITTRQTGYQLSVAPEVVDIDRFHALVHAADEVAEATRIGEAVQLLREALELWHGDALAGLQGRYLSSAADKLNEERLVAIERLAGLRLQLGETTALISDLVELVRTSPARESLRAILMTALDLAGRQADALEVYQDGRRWLAEEYGIDPGQRLQDLYTNILRHKTAPAVEAVEAEKGSAGPTANTATESTAATHRSFLPYAMEEFTGRATEITQLLAFNTQSRPSALVISTIDGMGGVGKTALAVQVARSMIEDFPDGQYFIDLRGYSVGHEPMSALDALGTLLGQFGVPIDQVPPDVEQRSALWRSSLSGQRALVLLDNANDVQQVAPLLPGSAETLVLITSRRRLASLAGARPLSLNTLPTDDAITLFVSIVGNDRVDRTRPELREIVEFCGHLPLAIRIAAARLRSRPSWTPEYLLGLLRDRLRRSHFLGTGDRSVSAVLAMSYRNLTAEQQRFLRLLSIHPAHDIDVASAAALTGVDVLSAGDVLESLYEDNLLMQEEPEAYQFHDLVRECAHQLFETHSADDERSAAYARLCDFYTQVAMLWCRPFARGAFRFGLEAEEIDKRVERPQSQEHARTLLISNASVLYAAARMSLDHVPSSQSWKLVCALQPLMKMSDYSGDAQQLFEDAAHAANIAHDERGEGLALTGLALTHRARGALAMARNHLETAISISRRLDDTSLEAYQLAELGIIERNAGNFDDAVIHFFRAQELSQHAGDDVLDAALGNNLGVLLKNMGQLEKALENFDRALTTCRTAGLRPTEALTLVNIAFLNNIQTNYRGAQDRFEEALSISDEIGEVRISAMARAGLCVTLRLAGELPESLATGRSSLATAREFHLFEAESEALNAIGESLLALRQVPEARNAFMHARDVAHVHGLTFMEGRACEGIAHVASVERRVTDARQAWLLALELHGSGVLDAAGAKAHLKAMDSGATVVCIRCKSGVGDTGIEPVTSRV